MTTERHENLSTADMVAASQPDRKPTPEAPKPASDSSSERPPVEASRKTEADRPGALLPSEEGGELRKRWQTIQTGFVDEPRRAVQDADSLVAQTMKRVAEVFAEERATLERQWTRGENVSTEDLRVAMKRYRSFFDRLLAA
jgi:hypothetical protein